MGDKPVVPKASRPLADRMRPRTLDELLGQDRIIGPGTLLRRAVEAGKIQSLILWGPPGSGKTSLAMLLAAQTQAHFITLSAVTAGVKDIREVVEGARRSLERSGTRTLLFIDEIHRFNKSQQDALLPHVEGGLLTLIGATTENPSFEVNSALLSRCRVYVLAALEERDIVALLRRALADPERGLGGEAIELEKDAMEALAAACHGDARGALNALELAVMAVRERPLTLTAAMLLEALQKKALLYDKSGEEHFNLISAFHKSLRGSDPDAALYWLARMLAAGEDPMYVARRIVRFASEDVGNADPQALTLAMAAMNAYHALGTPEGELALAQATLYLSTAPKSNACYTAFGQATQVAEEKGPLPPPLHIRNAPTRLMKDLGYGKGYQYDHDSPEGYLPQEYFPEGLEGTRFYHPVERGFEREILKRLDYWRKLRESKGQASV
ncbi:MAG: Replication-associated recombination protein A [bacterium]|nr:Replication-associated recombination protein A [bacterium]